MTTRSKKPLGYTCECGKVHLASQAWPQRWWAIELECFCAKCGRLNIVKNGVIQMPDRFRR